MTVRDAWVDFWGEAQAGTARNARSVTFKPATLRNYERGWKKINPELGAHKLTDVRRADVQAMVNRWVKAGEMEPSTIRNALDPLRLVYRRAIRLDLVAVAPTTSVDVPRDATEDDMRFASREEAAALLGVLPVEQRALWATAFYGRLRRGELRALRWSDVNLKAGTLRVERSWDDKDGEQAPKSKAARRTVPIVPPLAVLLDAHKKRTKYSAKDLVFGKTATASFDPTTVRKQALRAWAATDEAKAKQLGRKLAEDETLKPITLHQCRHTCASFLIASGANAKALSVVMGHATIGITFDRYGHLMPGGEAEVGRLLGAYLSG